AGDLAARLERLLRAGGGPPRTAVLVRPPLLRREHPPGPRGVPVHVPAVRAPRPAPRDGLRRGGLRGDRGAGPLARRPLAAVLRAAPLRPSGPAAHPRGGGRPRVHPRRARARRAVDPLTPRGRSRPG